MININIGKMAEVCGGELYIPAGMSKEEIVNKKPERVVINSQVVEDNYVFGAFVGEKADGHKYINQAFEKGAIAAICQRVPEDAAGPCIVVESTHNAMVEIARYYRTTLALKVVGIIGSVGKTSTKEYIASVLGQHFNITQTEGNHNNDLGIAMELLRIPEDTDIAVLEMGISDFGEMRKLSSMTVPDFCVFTNIAECHLENLNDRDGVLKAKTECFENMNRDGYVLLSGLDDKLDTIDMVNGKKPYRFGKEGQEVFASDVKIRGERGSDFVVNIKLNGEESSFSAHTELPGAHMINNALAATLTGKILGMSNEEIAAGIAAVQPMEGRSNIIKTDKYYVIDDCYNANGTSMKAGIDLFKSFPGRAVAILGDMYELGKEEEKVHRFVGQYAVSNGVEVLICVGPQSKAMFEAAKEALLCENQDIRHFEKRDDLIEKLPSIVKEGDVILVKASHGMHLEKVVEALV